MPPNLRHRLWQEAYAPATIKTHTDQIRQYRAFCTRHQLDLWTDESAVYWIFWSADARGVKKATLKAKLEAFKFFARHEHGRNGKAQEYGATWFLLARWITRRPDDATPKRHIGQQLLEKVLQRMVDRQGKQAARQLCAWYAVSYRALLRAGEAQMMRWQGVQFEGQKPGKLPSAMRVTLRPKAQLGEGSELFKTHAGAIELRFERRRSEGSCAVQQVYEWWRQCKKPVAGPVFICGEEAARKQLQATASEVTGVKAAEFGLHSLRAGGATDMEQKKMPLSQIKHLGRWKSAAVLLYMRGGEIAQTADALKCAGSVNERRAL